MPTAAAGNAWQPTRLVDELKVEAREEGLWNLFLPHPYKGQGGISNLDYAPLCEVMGRVMWSGEVFNCTRPTPATWRRWSATATRRRSASGWSRCWRRDPLGIPDDRAGGGLVGRHQHPVQHPP